MSNIFTDGVNLSKNQWHYKLQQFIFPGMRAFNSLCPYFWLTILCIIILIPALIIKGFAWAIRGMNRGITNAADAANTRLHDSWLKGLIKEARTSTVKEIENFVLLMKANHSFRYDNVPVSDNAWSFNNLSKKLRQSIIFYGTNSTANQYVKALGYEDVRDFEVQNGLQEYVHEKEFYGWSQSEIDELMQFNERSGRKKVSYLEFLKAIKALRKAEEEIKNRKYEAQKARTQKREKQIQGGMRAVEKLWTVLRYPILIFVLSLPLLGIMWLWHIINCNLAEIGQFFVVLGGVILVAGTVVLLIMGIIRIFRYLDVASGFERFFKNIGAWKGWIGIGNWFAKIFKDIGNFFTVFTAMAKAEKAKVCPAINWDEQ